MMDLGAAERAEWFKPVLLLLFAISAFAGLLALINFGLGAGGLFVYSPAALDAVELFGAITVLAVSFFALSGFLTTGLHRSLMLGLAFLMFGTFIIISLGAGPVTNTSLWLYLSGAIVSAALLAGAGLVAGVTGEQGERWIVASAGSVLLLVAALLYSRLSEKIAGRLPEVVTSGGGFSPFAAGLGALLFGLLVIATFNYCRIFIRTKSSTALLMALGVTLFLGGSVFNFFSRPWDGLFWSQEAFKALGFVAILGSIASATYRIKLF